MAWIEESVRKIFRAIRDYVAQIPDLITTTESLKLTVINSIEQIAYDLNDAAFSETTSIENDYILDSIEFNFSTEEVKTITVLSSDGTILWGGDVDQSSLNDGYNTTAKHLNLCFGQGFNGGENITITITQTSGACSADVILKTKQGAAGLTGNPILDPSSKIQIVDSNGDVWELESNGAMPVNIQDQNSQIINSYLVLPLAQVTLAADTALDDSEITLEAGHGASVGEYIGLKEDDRYYQGEIIAINVNTITLGSPLDYAFTTSARISRVTNDLSIDGSSSDQTFIFSPRFLQANTKWDITKMKIMIEGTGELDADKFGDLNALTNGIVIREVNSVWKNLLTARANRDMQEALDNPQYLDKPLYTFTADYNFAGQDKQGVTIRLSSDTDDELQCVVRDNLSGLVSFRIKVLGHIVTD